ncbi:MAG TPA: hypothetical protein VLF88_03340 [Candidatus Babeliales bacterium]|nr:hypothetical protein [Candidatus Babeliales bacterium]
MMRKVNTIDDLRLDILQAIKRAYIRKGYVPHKMHKEAEVSNHDQVQDEAPTVDHKIRIDHEAGQQDEKKAEQGPEELLEVTESSQEILYEAQTVFPFTLFPDSITLDREKITIADRFFWRTATITSVPVSEILSAQASVGPFFGSLHMVFSFFADNQKTLKFLWRQDAIELQRMLHGYIIAHKKEINTSTMELEDLKTLLHELGSGAND